MKSIKHLPDAVHSSLRSGVNLFDLTRVVEELVFNSIDAGASKINVAFSVGTCYVKVEDDGCGIARDGLVLLGERYATSKLHCLAEMDNVTKNFGFRGEALGSLSDVSLLEITTKARGRPNGYRKIMKACNLSCLLNSFLEEINLIVRDLFYNQPVRRKYMQASPKKVLHSVKKCVLRIALVHPQVSFQVIDIESEEQVLCTQSFSSPLPLVTSGFGPIISRSLRELNFSEGVLKLSGFLTAPLDTFSTKALQYLYVNSLFVCKGPIHKLLNNLSGSFKCLDPWKSPSASPNVKRIRTQQAYPAYILNFCCPRSSYDLTFEPSKTIVQFKEWVPVLAFIEQAIKRFLRQFPDQGELHKQDDEVSREKKLWKEDDHFVSPIRDISTDSEIAKKECSFSQTSLHISPLTWNNAEVQGYKEPTGFLHQIINNFHDMESTTWDAINFHCVSLVSPECGVHLRSPGKNLFGVDDSLLSSELTVQKSVEVSMVSPKCGIHLKSPGIYPFGVDDSQLPSELTARRSAEVWRGEFLGIDANVNEGSTRSLRPRSLFGSKDKTPYCSVFTKSLKKPFLRSCSSLGNVTPEKSMLLSRQGFEIRKDDCRTKRRRLDHYDVINVLDADDNNCSSNFSRESSLQGEFAISSPPSSIMKTSHKTRYLDVSSRGFLKEDLCDRLFEEPNLLDVSLTHARKRGFKWHSPSPHSLFGTVAGNLEPFRYGASEDYVMSRRSGSGSVKDFVDREAKEEILGCDTIETPYIGDESPDLNCKDSELDYKYRSTPNRFSYRSPSHEPQSNDIFIQKIFSTKNLADEIDWLCLDSSPCYRKDHGSRDELNFENHRQYHVQKERLRRSHSAPPFYKEKRKFSTVSNCLIATSKGQVNSDFEKPSQTLGVPKHSIELSPLRESLCRKSVEKWPEKKANVNEFQKNEGLEPSQKSYQDYNIDTVQSNAGHGSHNYHEQNDILDIASGILHLAGGSIVPDSISKDCLDDAKVLLQLDKKYIPVVAGVTLAVIDQHAADERIRLEELRQKVLSGEGKTIAYLDSQQELVLPEIGYQLLQNYANQIQNWGWICNIHSEGSRSFTKYFFLSFVPCILGVNLSEADLLEFLEQLAETDGSSTMPPAVLRVLNFKACRGAIMFGDALLPSECSLIIEELKQTSLCFQCAHGRPTTVPLVNLVALHKQIANLGSWNGSSDEPWHGLRRHVPSLERARQRLISSRG
ncbi:hypothetical protein GIB67_026811 [Kingdonia uniflora]|uniref:DNA mismatch repair protein MLH3 n=1 Tax=Kingdonia uniflora TaxID=39325 RepID=A0A7J7MHG1_9MAGN|nr:hypothetical protein GIB67_026811 [Kingdonia uniflora]